MSKRWIEFHQMSILLTWMKVLLVLCKAKSQWHLFEEDNRGACCLETIQKFLKVVLVQMHLELISLDSNSRIPLFNHQMMELPKMISLTDQICSTLIIQDIQTQRIQMLQPALKIRLSRDMWKSVPRWMEEWLLNKLSLTLKLVKNRLASLTGHQTIPLRALLSQQKKVKIQDWQVVSKMYQEALNELLKRWIHKWRILILHQKLLLTRVSRTVLYRVVFPLEASFRQSWKIQ